MKQPGRFVSASRHASAQHHDNVGASKRIFANKPSAGSAKGNRRAGNKGDENRNGDDWNRTSAVHG
jgi:hypothetical protein